MKQFHISYRAVTSKEFNEHLAYLKENNYIIKWYSYEEAVQNNLLSKFYFTAYFKINCVNLTLSYKRNFEWVSLCHNLTDIDNEDEIIQPTDPTMCYAILQRYVHIEDLTDRFGYTLNHLTNKITWCIPNFGGLRYVNMERVGKRYDNVYGYDMNSAFLSACIDLEIPREFIGYMRIPQEGEMGFNSLGEPVYEKELCYYVFKSEISEDLSRWARDMYKRKKNAKTPKDRQKYKDMGNFAIGCIARHNPFVRNCILYRINERMESLIDEDTLLCNTDSIVSLKERPDLKLGDELGEFKIEHTGNFALTETGYQWNYALPCICGFSKEKTIEFEKIMGRKYDILKDGVIDDFFMPRVFNYREFRIVNKNVDERMIKCLRRIYGDTMEKTER